MQRYFSNQRKGNCYLLSMDDSFHTEKVMRMKINDKIEVVDNKHVFICQVKEFNPVRAEIINEIEENHEMDKKIIVVQSMVNENKMDLIIQKCTELGVGEFYAYKAVNSVVKAQEKSDKKIIRWQKIVKEASEQSKRNIIPKVHNIVDLHALCEIKADLKILLSVNEKTKSVKKILQENKTCDTIIIVVGPEGGFSDQEEEKLIDNGFIRTSLGTRVLRTETAAIVFVSCVNYEWMV